MTNFDEPVQTRDGRPARIVARDYKGGNTAYPVLALVTGLDGYEYIHTYSIEGLFHAIVTGNDLDLVNVPEEKAVFRNIYASGRFGNPRESLVACHEASALSSRLCLGVLKVTYSDNHQVRAEVLA